MNHSTPGLPVHHHRPEFKLMSNELVMPSNHLILCRSLLLPPSIFPSIRVFSNESTLRKRWPKYWSFSFSISPSKEHPGLISFRMDWLDLLVVQGTLKSLLQHHSLKASIFWHSAFFSQTLTSIHDPPMASLQQVLQNFSYCIFQFRCSVMSDSLQPHRPQHARPPCPSPAPRACSNSCPLSQ